MRMTFFAVKGSCMSLDDYEAAQQTFEAAQVRSRVLTQDIQSAELDRLALLSPIAYGQERKGAARKLDVSVSLLDKEIEQRQRALNPSGGQGSGQPLILVGFEPAADPVDGGKMLGWLTATLGRFVVLPQHASLAIALWIVRAHADECFDTNPRLALLSPEKRCGKTTLLELIAKLVPKALPASNVTASVIFRTIEAAHPTLLIDEMDSFSDAQEELRGILNSGHRRETARVIRNVGDAHEPRAFSTWCPMVLAAIGHLPSTIEDRSIVVPMRRRAPHEPVHRLRWHNKAGQAVQAELRTLARAIARWTSDHGPSLMHCEPSVPEALNDRAADNWSPLLAIAEVIGEDWPEKARKAALALSGKEDTDTASAGIRLLADIRELFGSRDSQQLASPQLCEFLVQMEERPWGAWGKRGKPLSQNQLAGLLRPYGITSRSIRTAEGVLRGYALTDFTDAFDRYLMALSIPSLPSGPGNPLSDCYSTTSRAQSDDEPLFQGATEDLCSTSKNGTNPAPDAGCSGVAFQNPLFQGEEEIWEGPVC
jgi:putative DNA primase/helicase